MFLCWCHVSLLFHVSDGFTLTSVHLRVQSPFQTFGLASVGKDFHLKVAARALTKRVAVSLVPRKAQPCSFHAALSAEVNISTAKFKIYGMRY